MWMHGSNFKSPRFLLFSSLLLAVVTAGLAFLAGYRRHGESGVHCIVGDAGVVVIGQGGTSVEQKFVVENPSKKRPMHMQLIKKSCSCMDNLPEEFSTPPGDSTSLTVVASVNSVYATMQDVHWSILYRTDLPSVPKVALVLKATAVPEIETILPPPENWVVEPNETKKIAFRAVFRCDAQNSKGDVQLRRDCRDFVEVLDVEKERKGKYWEVALDCQAKIPRTSSGYGGVRERETATVLFVVDNGKTLEVPVAWTQRNHVTCNPRRLFFNARLDSQGKKDVRLRSDTNLRLVSLNDDGDNLSFQIDSNGNADRGKSAEFVCQLARNRNRGARHLVSKGNIIAELDHPTQRQVRIGYSILEAREALAAAHQARIGVMKNDGGSRITEASGD